MSRSVLVTLMVVAVAAAGACGEDTAAPTRPATPGDYVSAADRALRSPARMVGIVADQVASDTAPPPARARMDAIVADADEAGEDLARLDLTDPGLDRQRDALLARQRSIVDAMRRIVDPLTRGDRASLRAQAPSLYALVRRLPSDVAAASPRS